MEPVNPVLESIEAVVGESQHVKINHNELKRFCNCFEPNRHWLDYASFNLHDLNEKDKLAFMFVLDSSSFSYWCIPQWTVEHKGVRYERETFGLIACFGRALEEGIPILDPEFLSGLQRENYAHILRANTEIPMLDQRLRILNELGTVISDYGNFENFVDKADGDALVLMNQIVDELSSFDDSSVYHGKKVCFYKRAQLLTSDISNCYRKLKNYDKLTACADYKIPVVLRHCGIFEYSPRLAEKIEENIPISANSEEEVEIRMNTIKAVELIKEEVKHKFQGIDSMLVNDTLWIMAGDLLGEKYHLTRTTAY